MNKIENITFIGIDIEDNKIANIEIEIEGRYRFPLPIKILKHFSIEFENKVDITLKKGTVI